jgi:hypothetical protein
LSLYVTEDDAASLVAERIGCGPAKDDNPLWSELRRNKLSIDAKLVPPQFATMKGIYRERPNLNAGVVNPGYLTKQGTLSFQPRSWLIPNQWVAVSDYAQVQAARSEGHRVAVRLLTHEIDNMWPPLLSEGQLHAGHDPYRTGLPGRPTSKHLYLAELERRASLGLMLPEVKAESVALHHWLKKEHGSAAASASPKAIENSIRDTYRRLKGPKIIDRS